MEAVLRERAPGYTQKILLQPRSGPGLPRAIAVSSVVFVVKKLILWDIDGTLLHSDGAGERALVHALRDGFGLADDFAWLDYSGRTDRWIAGEILRHHGLPVTPENLQRYLDSYLHRLLAEMPRGQPHFLPGILELLETIRGLPDLAQGLLTGNLVRGARIKLEHFSAWHFFECGAFADDSEQRNDLGPHALRRARERHLAEFAPANTFVVGDTPHDIACGKAIGARTIAVATGRHALAELRAHAPDVVFPDFSDPPAFLRFVRSS